MISHDLPLGRLAALAAGLLLAAAAQAQEAPPAAPLEITSPGYGDEVPRQGEDPPCAFDASCAMVNVSGRVPSSCAHPLLAVAPLNASPRVWIQPPIASRTRKGHVEGVAYLGTPKVGRGEKDAIYLLCPESGDRWREGDVIEGIPADVPASDPVTVRRTQ